MKTLRRPGSYLAAFVVGIVAVVTGLPWWAGVTAATLALVLGAVLASVVPGVAHRPATPVASTSPSIGTTDPSVATFRLEGDYWTLAFRGPAFRIRDMKGLRYIHRLLQVPGDELHVLDMVSLGQGLRGIADAAFEEDLHLGGSSDQPMLDEQALRAYRTRLEDLQDQIDEAEANNDPERGARAREEIESILEQIDRARTPFGPRRFPAEAERARLNVTRAIKNAITKIRAQDASLGHHLDHNIRTGTYCCYEPDPADPLTWAL